MKKENVIVVTGLKCVSLTMCAKFNENDKNGQPRRVAVGVFSASEDDDISFLNDSDLYRGNLRIPDKYFAAEGGQPKTPELAFNQWKDNAMPKLGDEKHPIYGFVIRVEDLTDGVFTGLRNKSNGHIMQAFYIASQRNSIENAISIALRNYARATDAATGTHEAVKL